MSVSDHKLRELFSKYYNQPEENLIVIFGH